MSQRKQCRRCERPLSACLCHTITTIDNQVELVILQDPSEHKHAKGTAKLLKLSLQRCQLWVGQDFSDHYGLNQRLADPNRCVLLLYPGEQALAPEAFRDTADLPHTTIILLDGTWKKAYKLLCLNPQLAQLPRIGITPKASTNYRIRKAPRADSLSSVEAGYAILSALENSSEKFQPLLNAFDYLVDYQLQRMPATARQRYQDRANSPQHSSEAKRR